MRRRDETRMPAAERPDVLAGDLDTVTALGMDPKGTDRCS